MADPDRTASRSLRLSKALEEKPYNFGFFQAVRRIECIHKEKPRIGRSLRPVDDPVRLGQEPSLAFAPSTLSSFQPRDGAGAPRLQSRFFGLFGPNGPLPLHLTEYARDRMRNQRDPTMSRFLDVFHHRMLSLFYRAWALAQPTVSYDRPESDWYGLYVGSLFGLGMPAVKRRDSVPDEAKLYYVGRFGCQTRHPEGLRAVLEDFFRVPARIEEFVGEWMELPYEQRCRLGESTDTGTLGLNAIAGERVWGTQHKFRVRFGSVGYADFERLLPGGESLRRLVDMIRNYVGDELNWDLQLVLKKEEVPPLQLGGMARLGWTTWAGPRQEDTDADDLVLRPMAYLH